MAAFRNQHFVPKCYLKAFSLQREGAAINLYNIDRRRGIKDAPVKNQCAAAYFYGDDLELERTLQGSEGFYSNTLRNIFQPNYELAADDEFVLKHFCYLQYCRTDAAARRNEQFIAEMLNVAHDGDIPPDWQTSMRASVLAGMRAFAQTMRIVDDLRVGLVKNRTRKAFITSDDPAIMTNKWHPQHALAKGRSCGVGAAGVIFFLPLSPDILCVIYDGDVYSLPDRGGWALANKVADVDAFNEHQFLNCVANIYFENWDGLPEIRQDFESYVERRPAARYEVTIAVLDREDRHGQHYRVVAREELDGERNADALIHVKSIPVRPHRWPSLIKKRLRPKVYSNGTGTGFVRRAGVEQGFHGGGNYNLVPFA